MSIPFRDTRLNAVLPSPTTIRARDYAGEGILSSLSNKPVSSPHAPFLEIFLALTQDCTGRNPTDRHRPEKGVGVGKRSISERPEQIPL